MVALARQAATVDVMIKPQSTVVEDDVAPPVEAARNAAPDGPGGHHHDLALLASQHGFSIGALNELYRAMSVSGGAMAQFSHPELGGSGQWMRNGMVMVGDMFNHRLAARVGALCEALVPLVGAGREGTAQRRPGGEGQPPPAAQEQFGLPAASGSQNGMRYAWFPAHRRLVVERHGRRQVFDTADHAIHGVAQQQSGSGTITFTSQHGPVDLASLKELGAGAGGSPVLSPGEAPAAEADAGPHGPTRARSGPQPSRLGDVEAAGSAAATTQAQILDLLSKLAELHTRGVLTDQEFTSKKAQLLDRL